MSLTLVHAPNGRYAIHGLITCRIQGTAICHKKGECAECDIALAHLNPEVPFYILHGVCD